MHALSIQGLNVWYGSNQSLKSVTLNIPARQITAIIGPSGCGKTTLLKALNRLLDLQENVRVQGKVFFDGADIYAAATDVTEVRTRIGLLAQKPFPLPMSIYDNIAYGPRIHGSSKGKLPELVRTRLEEVGLWNEVADRLKAPATGLSVGQQQRLCLARALAVEPEILLRYTVVMVTHDIDQARRLADHVVFMWLGELIEHGPADEFFHQPTQTLTRSYLNREIG